MIPVDLPPTTGPCPHCKEVITSPAPEFQAVAPPVMPVAVPAPAPARETMVEPDARAGVSASAETPEEPVRTVPEGGGGEDSPPVDDALPAGSRQPESPLPAEKPLAKPAVAKREAAVRHAAPGRPRRAGVIGALVVAALLVGGAAVLSFWLAKQSAAAGRGGLKQADPAAEGEIDEARYIRVGWVAEARTVLRQFIAARTPREKARHVFDGERLLPAMEEFYGGGMIDDRDTPAETFSVYDLAEEDRRRGIFLMTYDLPPQFELRTFFRPLAPLDVQLGVEEPDLLLSTFARVANFSSEPVRVHAFFKRTPEGMRLDWETFVQTKYRMLRSFVEAADPGRSQVFRVILIEDVPEAGVGSKGARTYRLIDPVNFSDATRVEVPVDSETGRILSAVNWRGAGGVKAVPKTATVELGWEGGESPRLRIRRFICWEFLGLGGSEGNAGSEGGR